MQELLLLEVDSPDKLLITIGAVVAKEVSFSAQVKSISLLLFANKF